MQKTKKNLLRPGIMILIGIILIALSFTLWYYAIPPFTGISRNDITLASAASPKITFLTSNSTNPATVYFGSPIDKSFNLSMRISATNGPINVTIYARDTAVRTVQTNFTIRTIIFNSTLYNNASISRPANSLVVPSVNATIPSSLLDAFTGGTTPYMIIRNLNTNSTTSVSFQYSYSALFRNSNGIPMLLFIVGVIIVVVYGIAFIRRFMKRSRGR
ncbi:MAG TPA: hypothetical protein VMS95_02930 [Candidatus Krumholzibacteriaceae bacterium]|nr:hypothetical protein [Candidatus Krumholzibacteriaceae bacterium]